jgi:hypothetical protein
MRSHIVIHSIYPRPYLCTQLYTKTGENKLKLMNTLTHQAREKKCAKKMRSPESEASSSSSSDEEDASFFFLGGGAINFLPVRESERERRGLGCGGGGPRQIDTNTDVQTQKQNAQPHTIHTHTLA